jgi:hypothetical protein
VSRASGSDEAAGALAWLVKALADEPVEEAVLAERFAGGRP